MVSQNRVGHHAMNLLSDLAIYREKEETVSFAGPIRDWKLKNNRMIGHSFLCAIAWEASFVKMCGSPSSAICKT